jgi:GC-rich sequence DNA-binding factor
LAKASGVFEDVVDDFSSLRSIKQRFEEWRTEHSAGYYKCFAGVSLVDICVPYVKLQTLMWDPLSPGARTFEDLEWYTTLSTYGLASTAKAGEGKKQEAEEAELVPSLVRRVILPKARAFIAQAWDPRSRQQTRRVQTLVGDLLVYLPAQADLKTLLQAVMLGLQAAVDRVRLPTAYLGLSDSANQFAMSQFWNAVKLMGNIASWHEQLSNRALRGLALDKLLNGQIVPFMRQMKFAATESGITR